MEPPRTHRVTRPGSRSRTPPVEAPAKRLLAEKLNRMLDGRVLSQSEVAKLVAIPQSRVSAIRHYNLRGISMQRLMRAITDLGHQIEIVVTAMDLPAQARIDVTL